MELQVGVKALLRLAASRQVKPCFICGERTKWKNVRCEHFSKNNEGKYLLLRRSSEKYPEVGAIWDIVGGRIDPGSPLLENLKREIKEETGLDLNDEPKLIAAQDILRVPGKHIVRLTYTARIDGEPKLDSDNTEFKWFAREELESLENLDVYFKELLSKKLIP